MTTWPKRPEQLEQAVEEFIVTVSQHFLARRALTRSALAASLVAPIVATACRADEIATIGQGRHLELSVGGRFDVLLRAGALGSYNAPPTISAAAVEFLEATLLDESPIPPAGPLQRFRYSRDPVAEEWASRPAV